jgi:hypothetical protein
MDASSLSTLKDGGFAAAVVVIGWRLLRMLINAHQAAMRAQRADLLQALADQRKDFITSLKTIRESCLKPSLNLLMLLLLLLPGCTAGQGGTLGDFSLTTPLGSMSIKTVNITPASPALPCTRSSSPVVVAPPVVSPASP